jgi:rhodanese-related sulfurtransferase
MVGLLLSLTVVGWGCITGRLEGTSSAGADRPTTSEPEKPMPIAQITPEEAKRLLDGGGFVYLDVRTVPEFINGHAPSALNIPVVEMNPQLGAMELNEKFLSVVAANIPPDSKLIVGCKTGGRSTTACKVLAQAGYKNLRNLVGGYAGITDPTGHVVKEGWSTLGYPTERGDGGVKGYASLSTTAKR